jgi:L-ascorbate metabolism protein UlaG (beta-lactamase superfamily)
MKTRLPHRRAIASAARSVLWWENRAHPFPAPLGGGAGAGLSASSLPMERAVGASRRIFGVAAALAAAFLLASGVARGAAPDRCLAVAGAPHPPAVHHASTRLAQLKPEEVRVTYVGHSTFLIESAGGVTIATDYNDYVRPRIIPAIVTMNLAHDTHHTNNPNPAIRYVLRGWNPDGGAAQHDLTLLDVRVRNVPTNIRGGDGRTATYGNSIFVFEVAGLCIAHLGHLHHTLTSQQLSQIGQMDVVMVPVDGSYTLDLDGMTEVLMALKAPYIIPMHYFSIFTLERFLTRVRGTFEVVHHEVSTIVLSRVSLPEKQRVLVLPGR